MVKERKVSRKTKKTVVREDLDRGSDLHGKIDAAGRKKLEARTSK